MTTDLYTIARVCGGTLAPGANGARRVCGFYTDSRTAEKEKIFLAIKGEHFDGNSFAGALVQGGHAAIVSEPSAAVRGDVILVRDVRAALLTLARYYRENVISGVKVVGVTGSVGKTTTKEMIALALSATEKVFKTPGNANSLLGLPISLLSVPEDADAAVLEMGINQPGEMERLSSAAMPDISVVTNIGHSHIEFFGTRKAICAEKLRVASHSAPGSKILLCTDEPLLAGRESVYGARVVAVSAASPSAYAYATDVVDTANGLSFTAHIGGGEYPVSLPAGGRAFPAQYARCSGCVRAFGRRCFCRRKGALRLQERRQTSVYIHKRRAHGNIRLLQRIAGIGCRRAFGAFQSRGQADRRARRYARARCECRRASPRGRQSRCRQCRCIGHIRHTGTLYRRNGCGTGGIQLCAG